MKFKSLYIYTLSIFLLFIFSGCTHQIDNPYTPAEIDALLDKQLGLLTEHITEEEHEAAQKILSELIPIQQERIKKGIFDYTQKEVRLLTELNDLYENYTAKYLGMHELEWNLSEREEKVLAAYRIEETGDLVLYPESLNLEESEWSEEQLRAIWSEVLEILPEEAFKQFEQLVLATDGKEGMASYVRTLDEAGTRWELTIDPINLDDQDYFVDTIIHEYFHYVTLNSEQVDYTNEQTIDTYNEEGMVFRPDSYLDDFYQAFWLDYIHDRRINQEGIGFFLRHEDDFLNSYAASTPSEDICESFVAFVMRDEIAGEKVWEQKVLFFYEYPELVEMRATLRAQLGLDTEDKLSD